VNYPELSADPAVQGLCALVFTLVLMSMVHNHLQTGQQQVSGVATKTWGMGVLKQGLVAALLFTDVIRESEGTVVVDEFHS